MRSEDFDEYSHLWLNNNNSGTKTSTNLMISGNRNGRSVCRRNRVQLNQVAKVNGSNLDDSCDKSNRIKTESSDSISYHEGDAGADANVCSAKVDASIEPEKLLTTATSKWSKGRANRRFKKLLSSGSNTMETSKMNKPNDRKRREMSNNCEWSKPVKTKGAEKSNMTERWPLDQLPLRKLEVPRNVLDKPHQRWKRDRVEIDKPLRPSKFLITHQKIHS